MPGLGAPELLIILVIVLLIFGAGKLPQIGNALGRSIREFRETSDGKDTTTPPADTTPSEQKKSGL
jgi:sec-independent protein translocase protein TatA